MTYCANCKPGVPAVALYTARSGDGGTSGTTRQAGACPRHQEAVRAWVARVGPVTEQLVRAPPHPAAAEPQDQQALF